MPTRNLSALLEGINVEETQGDVSVSVNAVVYDSRSVTPGALFVALPGLHVDGHDYLVDAVARGAAALVVERPVDAEPGAVLPTVVRVTNSRRALSALAAAFYDHPSRKLRVIGVTGTDGKSSTCAYIHQLLAGLGKKVGLLSTVSVDRGRGIEENPFRQSTPEAPEVHRFLREMVDAGLEYAVLEATSHGLSEKTNRLADIAFDVAVFTNLTHEHLEFHGSYEQYRHDKANLFRAIDRSPEGFGVVNAQDKEADYFAAQTNRRVLRYGIECPDCALSATSVKGDISGTRFTVCTESSESKTEISIPGTFQVENTLAALLTAVTLTGSKITQCCALVPGITPVPGRMVRVGRSLPFSVFIDYAHTPGAFEQVLPLLRSFTSGRLIAVFGSAGERDVEKRELQGSIAAKYADILVITDEDPRQEDAQSILRQIAEGARTQPGRRVRRGDIILIADRRKAIHHALSLAKAKDTVVLLGKGHEKSIIYPEGPVPWNEQEAATEALRQLGFAVQPPGGEEVTS
ncbi:MAG: UDP-N-acetylmuramoyl-L-alanyl-D-glutamate--2,6-diaminopimelate ligase [Spirochaetaceae bacterium]